MSDSDLIAELESIRDKADEVLATCELLNVRLEGMVQSLQTIMPVRA